MSDNNTHQQYSSLLSLPPPTHPHAHTHSRKQGQYSSLLHLCYRHKHISSNVDVGLKRGTQSLQSGQLALCDWLPWETDCCGFKLQLAGRYHVRTSTSSLSASWKKTLTLIFQWAIFGYKCKLLMKVQVEKTELCRESVDAKRFLLSRNHMKGPKQTTC